MGVIHVTKYGLFKPGALGPVTGIQHNADAVGTAACRVCGRIVIRGAGRWWE
jgi:hypothetical protein